MTAKEMFELIGFKCKKNNNKKIIYKHKGYKKIIVNLKKNKLIVKSRFNLLDSYCNLTTREFLAISKLLEELELTKCQYSEEHTSDTIKVELKSGDNNVV